MIHQKVTAANDAGHWCIIRMAGPRTLTVVAALNAAGVEAWTPIKNGLRSRHRKTKEKVPYQAPITPTFAFVRANHLTSLRAALAMPVNPFPSFSIFQYAGRIPAIADAEIRGFRLEEEAAAERFVVERSAYEAERNREKRKALRREMAVGTEIALGGAWLGKIGTIVSGNRKEVWVEVGGKRQIKIDTWLLADNRVGTVLA